MKTSLVKELLLYRYRFGLGYGLYIIFVIVLLTVGIGNIPIGTTLSEMKSVVESTHFTIANLLTTSYIDAPYHVLQNASVHLFGLNDVSIKLPSLIFALIAAVALVIMLSRWFVPRIAVITGLLSVTTTPFLGMGRFGTPLIMMTFWLSIILLAATRILHSAKHSLFWKFVLAFCIGFSLYTPLMIYPLIALSIAGLLHPHVRYVVRNIKPSRAVIAIILFTLAITPLGWTIYHQPHTIFQLLGLPESVPTFSQIVANFSYVIKSLVRVNSPIAAEIITPMFGIITIIIAVLGLLKSGAEWYSARSYMIGIWLALIIPVIIINPYYLPAVFIPMVLLMAIGIDSLIRNWYQLFPRNPYARIAGLIPLTVLIAAVSFTNAGRYFYGYLYNPHVESFHTELRATHAALNTPGIKSKPVTLVTTPETQPFYQILTWTYPKLTVTSTDNPAADATIVHETAYPTVQVHRETQVPYRLFTNPYTSNGLDVRVYTKQDS